MDMTAKSGFRGRNRLSIFIFIVFLLVGNSVASAAPDGAELYERHCSVCHGSDGRGGVGVPLALPSFLSTVDDRFLRESIRLGRPGRVMPGFPKLSDAQLDALVAHLRSWCDVPAPTFPVHPIEGDSLRGARLFADNCASCHGDNAVGGTGTGVTFSRARELPIIAPALNNPGFLAAASDELILHTLTYGREGTPMTSALVAGLSERDLNDLVAYIRSLESQPVDVPESADDESAVIIVESPYSLEETVENLEQAITDQNFTLIRSEPLEFGLVPEGEEQQGEVVLHFCNFRFLFEALGIDPRVGMFLPCRVTVVERGDKVLVMSINPLRLSHLFNNRELDEACKEMNTIYTTIMEDATL